jgi:hypothetical protein
MLDAVGDIGNRGFAAQLLHFLLSEDRRHGSILSGGCRVDTCGNELREGDQGAGQQGNGENRLNEGEAARHTGSRLQRPSRPLIAGFPEGF